MDKVFKALSDKTRRELLDRLFSKDGQTLGELCEYLSMTRQAVTKHLVLLEEANLIVVQWKGREKLHYLNPVPIREVYERWVSKYERGRLTAISNLKQALEKPNNKKTSP
ncbi:MAG TPA: helix-turn-helix domain-containing protein [Candidatus Kapabacteria bacterium]|nr:helix-turn-helix domain-containing protein [Candidatus Kapabacteria bacterium]